MNPQTILEHFLANLPTILFVLGTLGLWKLGANLIRRFSKEGRGAVAATPTKVDDVIFNPIFDMMDAAAAKLERGELPEGLDQLNKARTQAAALKRGQLPATVQLRADKR